MVARTKYTSDYLKIFSRIKEQRYYLVPNHQQWESLEVHHLRDPDKEKVKDVVRHQCTHTHTHTHTHTIVIIIISSKTPLLFQAKALKEAL